MMQSNLQRPKKRSPLRIWSGTQVYTLKRRLEWMTDKRKYVSKRNPDPMPYLIHTHRTPLSHSSISPTPRCRHGSSA